MLSCHFSGMPPLSVPPGPDEALKRGKDREQAVANLVKRTRPVIHGPYGIEAYNLEESGADFKAGELSELSVVVAPVFSVVSGVPGVAGVGVGVASIRQRNMMRTYDPCWQQWDVHCLGNLRNGPVQKSSVAKPQVRGCNRRQDYSSDLSC